MIIFFLVAPIHCGSSLLHLCILLSHSVFQLLEAHGNLQIEVHFWLHLQPAVLDPVGRRKRTRADIMQLLSGRMEDFIHCGEDTAVIVINSDYKIELWSSLASAIFGWDQVVLSPRPYISISVL